MTTDSDIFLHSIIKAHEKLSSQDPLFYNLCGEKVKNLAEEALRLYQDSLKVVEEVKLEASSGDSQSIDDLYSKSWKQVKKDFNVDSNNYNTDQMLILKNKAWVKTLVKYLDQKGI